MLVGLILKVCFHCVLDCDLGQSADGAPASTDRRRQWLHEYTSSHITHPSFLNVQHSVVEITASSSTALIWEVQELEPAVQFWWVIGGAGVVTFCEYMYLTCYIRNLAHHVPLPILVWRSSILLQHNSTAGPTRTRVRSFDGVLHWCSMHVYRSRADVILKTLFVT